MFLTIIIFIIMLGLLIFVHELGHFMVARRNGIKAEEFGFGFPPRIFGFLKDPSSGKWKFIKGNKEIKSKNTIYSINWIPLGGFVRIKGEDGENAVDKDSFASKSAWKRIKVLIAGVAMNFFLAWILISIALAIGAPQAIESRSDATGPVAIQVAEIVPNSPADQAGVEIGDEIIGCIGTGQVCKNSFSSISELQDYTNENKGKEITLKIKRGKEDSTRVLTPRQDYPKEEGPLGVSLVETAIVSYPIHIALWEGIKATIGVTIAIFLAFGSILHDLFLGQKLSLEVAGPVGIASMTQQATQLGFAYLLQFAALLSINLGIINGLPFPALDGGRILFILIEKIKGSPVSKNVEQVIHTVGFVLLILLMLFITARDILKLV